MYRGPVRSHPVRLETRQFLSRLDICRPNIPSLLRYRLNLYRP
jgi:hypothetical protein